MFDPPKAPWEASSQTGLNEPCNQNNGEIPTPALVRTLLSVENSVREPPPNSSSPHDPAAVANTLNWSRRQRWENWCGCSVGYFYLSPWFNKFINVWKFPVSIGIFQWGNRERGKNISTNQADQNRGRKIRQHNNALEIIKNVLRFGANTIIFSLLISFFLLSFNIHFFFRTIQHYHYVLFLFSFLDNFCITLKLLKLI